MKLKIVIAIYLIMNCAGLVHFLIKGNQIEDGSKGPLLAAKEAIETNNRLIANPRIDDIPESHLFKPFLRLLSSSINLNISTIRSLQDIAARSIVLSGLNSLFFAVCLARMLRIKNP